jgi:hypothetical protein
MTTYNAVTRHCYGTAASWTSNNPTLLAGEIGVESDTGKTKVGDGTTAWTSLDYNSLPATDIRRQVVLVVGNGTDAVTTADKAMVRLPSGIGTQQWTITGWTLVSVDSTMAAVSGSCTLDLWVDTYANFPPTNADTITASAKPSLSAASKNASTTLTGWDTAIVDGDFIVLEVESSTTCKQIMLYLDLQVAA